MALTYDVEWNGGTVLAGTGLSGTASSWTFGYSAGGVLDLDIQLVGGATMTGPATTWVFSGATFDAGTGPIADVTNAGGVFTPTIFDITDTGFKITTSGSDSTGVANALLQYSFNIAPFSGAAAVPEPSSVAMLCALGLGGVWVRRRRQSVA